jgi:CRISPR-associated protein Cmr4
MSDYHKAYGIIETQAPLHVGASAGEENGNLNLIFRDQFTLTGIIPGSSIRGRFRAAMRHQNGNVDHWYGKAVNHSPSATQESATNGNNNTSESRIKFEYASIVWLPVYCPNQPIVYVSCPALLKRYQKITGQTITDIKPYSYYGKPLSKTLFFNLGFLPLKQENPALKDLFPQAIESEPKHLLVVVDDREISMIHDMGLYRQSRVALEPDEKKAKKGAFFDVEALPEGTIMAFPLAMRKTTGDTPEEWQQFFQDSQFNPKCQELYFGGLESIGFGRTQVSLQSVNSR